MREVPEDRIVVGLPVDWVEHNGWKCLFCGGDIDHFDTDDREQKYADDSYKCEDKGHLLCESAYFMVRWSKERRGENGDALTLAHWVEIEFNGSLASGSFA